jgi:hypothetical protein
MADKKISDLTALTGANVADADLLPIVDTSATETKKITFAEFKTALDTATGFVRITGDTMTGDLSFGVNNKAIFGAGSDLEIYHDGTNNRLTFASANTYIQTDGIVHFTDIGNNEKHLTINDDGAVDLYHNNVLKLATTATGIDVTGVITTDGMTTSANINFGDNDKAIFGAGSSLQIFSDSTDSFINESGIGHLYIQATNLRFKSLAGENFMALNEDGAVTSYYNNAPKLATTNTGIDVTGTVVADGLTVEGASAGGTYITSSSGSAAGDVKIEHIINSGRNLNTINSESGSGSAIALAFSTGETKRLNIASNGDINFYATDGTTQAFHWDATDSFLGLGTTLPEAELHIAKSTSGGRGGTLVIENSHSSILNNEVQIAFLTDSGAALAGISNARIKAINTDAGSGAAALTFTTWNGSAEGERMRIDSSGNVGIGVAPATRLDVAGGVNGAHATFSGQAGRGLVISTANTLSNDDGVIYNAQTASSGKHIFQIAGTERMRIDSSGSWMVGNTVARTTSQYSNQGGASWYQTDQHFEISTTSNVPALEVGKNNANDGSLIAFRKQADVVGSIGTEPSNSDLYIGNGDTAIMFHDGADAIFPHNASTNAGRDAAIDIGYSTYRFKDLYLSGDVITGGGGTGNTGEIQFVADSTRARIVGGYDSGGGGYIAFRTDTTGGTDLERARFNNAGNLAFTSGNGIDFSAVTGGTGTATSNVLDDYEEGTWTGTLTGSTSAPSTAITATGTYTKIGRSVTAVIAFSNKDSTGVSGNIVVTGLPFTAAAGGLGAGWNGRSNTGTGTTNGVMSFIASNNDLVLLNGLGASITWVSAGTGTYAGYSITYEV